MFLVALFFSVLPAGFVDQSTRMRLISRGYVANLKGYPDGRRENHLLYSRRPQLGLPAQSLHPLALEIC